MKTTNSNFKKLLVATSALGVAAFVGCGDDNTTVNETTGITQLAKGEAFPECSDDNAGEMIFAADSGKVYFCAEGSWETLNGENGSDGKDGADGKDGVDGKDGADGVNGKDGVDGKDGESSIDTLVISNRDTVVVLDTLVGLNGQSCNAEALSDGSGYQIICGEDTVGTVVNGKDGENGEDGEDGTSCTLKDDGNGKVTLSCGKNSVELYKALCGTTAYDPATQFCDESVYTLCGGETFDPATEYCSNGTVAAYASLTDSRDNQVYKTVKIGEQVWMAENLNYASEGSYCYNDDETNCETYGRLYTWTDAATVCPAGWHLPSAAEFKTLIATVGDSAGLKLKVTDSWGLSWTTTKTNGTDAYGFSALPAGIRSSAGKYVYGYEGYNSSDASTNFWSTAEYANNTNLGKFLYVSWRVSANELSNGDKGAAFSVRCLQD